MQFYQRPEILLEIPDNVEFINDLSYTDSDLHSRQNLHLLKPKNITKKLPLIIYIHGGAWLHGDKDLQIPHLIPYVASGDFIAVALNYRFSQQAPWPAQIDDCKTALSYLLKNSDKYGIDTEKVAIWGSSSGAHLSLHLVNDPRVHANVAYCAPSHFRPLLEVMKAEEHHLKSHGAADSPVIQLIGCNPLENPQKLLAASPFEYISQDSCPTLLAHGTEDEAVPYGQSLAIKEKADSLGIDFNLITLNGYKHKFSHPDLDEAVKNFFYYHLHGQGESSQDFKIN
ncbi:alpha/beta hydrolase [Lentisphaera profundi]|uniref:Alpha/beta hydrolase n=1 Tax=Lentisphaera profundi TaxID=1658616 RepID=A0ABY7VVX0_9BACT|nr:alpha/beta hydrolase [Lentisphaera profundi]WDE97360.1 alpha/beta hydrolase [Lentisphaera profundi]